MSKTSEESYGKFWPNIKRYTKFIAKHPKMAPWLTFAGYNKGQLTTGLGMEKLLLERKTRKNLRNVKKLRKQREKRENKKTSQIKGANVGKAAKSTRMTTDPLAYKALKRIRG